MTTDSGWTAEALDYAIRHNLELQGSISGELLRLDEVAFSQRDSRYRQQVQDLIDQIDGLQAEFVTLNKIEPMR